MSLFVQFCIILSYYLWKQGFPIAAWIKIMGQGEKMKKRRYLILKGDIQVDMFYNPTKYH